ncbi:carbohydrate ABC transporter permease [Ureibacillus acetophenoni]|uniref:Carbohydrate ABC transporter membrane protein 1 (CUT1 family) n=1 Tax=Ureibacillus acetophenoni TaxID=614649 RepID=A0A285U6S8_9BACL|nr:sugar ABC transporter permease [Ureibacillus acetophenoni]SOC37098.1 carbohydrate ABC transporter membrane protein 1 (CUT1 family) [Ureibacillus acetophenoni]
MTQVKLDPVEQATVKENRLQDTKELKKSHKKPNRVWQDMKKNYSAYLFLLPKLILFVLFVAFPVVWAIVLSFQEYRFNGSIFIGLDNYIAVFKSEAFRIALKNTLLFTVVTVPFSVISALVISVMIFGLGKISQSFFRSAFYLPSVTSMVIIAMVWRWMYNYDFGLFNYFLSWFGVEPINWLGQSATALWALIIMSCLIPFGTGIIMYLASMGSISQSLYEAARIDGANSIKQFFHITVPLLKPTTLYLVLLSTIGSFQVFTQIIMMTGGGPGSSTETLVHLIYKTGFRDFEYGLASAQAVVLFVIILIFSIIQFRVLRHDE